MINSIQEIADQMVVVRQHLHCNPELSFKEFETSAYIADRLSSHNIHFQTVAHTGLLAVVTGNHPGDDRLIRADIDALPITEQSSYQHPSTNDAMHACGHDIHTSVLLGVLIYLSQHPDAFSGSVIGLFQPGEEQSPGGASMVIADGILDKFNIKAAYALHTAHDMEVGKFGVRSGCYMASTAEMQITVKGSGGHAALPKSVTNPILGASDLILALKEIETKEHNTIVAVGRVIAEGSTNVIPTTVSLSGTIRAMSLSKREDLKNCILSTSKNIEEHYGLKIEIRFGDGYPPVTNDPQLSTAAIQQLKESFGEENILALDKRMTADDFGFFSERYPSFYYRLGVKGSWSENFAPHTPQFIADDRSIYYGIRSMLTIIGSQLK